jgi:type IV pilus assembly protein PilA
MQLRHSHRFSSAAGFSMLELVAVLAVSALMGLVGISAYRTYTVRAQVSAGLVHAESIRGRVAAAYEISGERPADGRAAGVPFPAADAAELIDDIRVEDGRVGITFSPEADAAIAGRTLYLAPFETADRKVVWVCGNRVAGVGLKPLGFATGAYASAQLLTTIEPRFLPSTCR